MQTPRKCDSVTPVCCLRCSCAKCSADGVSFSYNVPDLPELHDALSKSEWTGVFRRFKAPGNHTVQYWDCVILCKTALCYVPQYLGDILPDRGQSYETDFSLSEDQVDQLHPLQNAMHREFMRDHVALCDDAADNDGMVH